MRKIILHFGITLDGIVSNVEQWISLPDESIRDQNAYQATLSAIIFGKNSVAGLTGYWENAETSSNSAEERLFAKNLNDIRKYVLSHGEMDLSWRNTELLQVKNDKAFKQAIERLKNAPGGDIWVAAGEGTWRSFLEADLWDGLDMLVHPLVMGKGKPLFTSYHTKAPLRLVYSKTYANGLANLRYERG